MTPAARIRHAVECGMFLRERAALASPARGSLVFVHGLGESGLCFEPLLVHRGFDDWARVILDLPGYGRSAWRDEPLPLADQAAVLGRWLAGRADLPRPWIIVGHSMGGVVGILLAESAPEVVDVLVDVDGNVSLGDCVFSGRAARVGLEDFLAGGFDRLRETVRRQGGRAIAQRGYYASMRLADPRQFHLNSRELVELSTQERLGARLRALVMPAHYVAGVPGGACARSLEILARDGVRWHGVQESGHWPFIDRPDAFVDLLRTILP